MRRSATDTPLGGQLVASERSHLTWVGGVVHDGAHGLLAAYLPAQPADLGFGGLVFIAKDGDDLIVVLRRLFGLTFPSERFS
ncbi:hypothetical protein [Nonomuraea typhae]|uniref:Uncharacterized protein n=1 Tax=Nonomuraea typhae TaxID=2603600 RepID=A0ABW7YYN5_9ACTN